MTRGLKMAFILLLAGVPAFALAQGGGDTPARPQSFEAVVRCRAIADNAERLACFDAAVAALQTAQERRDVVIVDRQQVREGRRRLFGLALPRIPIFGGGDDDDHDQDAVRSLESTVSAVSTSNGQYQVTLADGSVWVQVDNNMLAVPPRAGHRIVINRGALGSYMMRVNNQPGVRVRRVR